MRITVVTILHWLSLSFAAESQSKCADLNTKLPKWLEELNLPLEMLTYFVNSRSDLRQRCLTDDSCPFKEFIKSGKCIGHEPECDFEATFSYRHILNCLGNSNWPEARRKIDQKKLFWNQGDFGYVKERVDSMADICVSESHDKEGSYLACSDHLKHCYARNIFFDLKGLNAKNSARYREDVIGEGQVGGRCGLELREHLIRLRGDHRSYLQSWADELWPFKSVDTFKVDAAHCDVIFERPTIIMKLDASVNMYHHFCDFINLFASQFVNGSFSDDVDILWWDTHSGGFRDSMFGAVWKAFSRHTPIELISLDQKRVCFREAMMPLLARQRMGLFFNTPVVQGCSGSVMFRWMSKMILHRLNMAQQGPLPRKLRVTLLSRSTSFRRIMNEHEIIEAIEANSDYEFRRVDFKPQQPPFTEQMAIMHNSDILMSMHGSGLTHLLFLPDWASVFEIFNCDDRGCYSDLARLRGVNYRTWDDPKKMTQHGPGKHPRNGTPHKKFTNYSFDVDEFMRILSEMAVSVRQHVDYERALAQVHGLCETFADPPVKLGPHPRSQEEL